MEVLVFCIAFVRKFVFSVVHFELKIKFWLKTNAVGLTVQVNHTFSFLFFMLLYNHITMAITVLLINAPCSTHCRITKHCTTIMPTHSCILHMKLLSKKVIHNLYFYREKVKLLILTKNVQKHFSVQTGGSVDLAGTHHEKSHLHMLRNYMETWAANLDHIQCSALLASYTQK